MEKLFLSSLKNQTALQSLRNAIPATFALLGFAFFKLSFWTVLFACILFCFSYFFGKEKRSEAGNPLFFVFSVTAVTSILFLVFQSSFFDYWTITQWMPFLLSFLFYGVVFMSPLPDVDRERMRISFLRTVVLLFLAVSAVLFTERMMIFGYGFLFVNIFILYRGLSREEFGIYSVRARAFALFSALVGVELLFTLRFLPLLFLVTGGLIAVFLTLLWDVMLAHINGRFSRKLVISKVLIFSLFLVFVSFFTKWTL